MADRRKPVHSGNIRPRGGSPHLQQKEQPIPNSGENIENPDFGHSP